jgi:hypothetical protein
MGAFPATVFSLMGQQSNKVQKRKRRLDYKKRKKLLAKTSIATAKPAAAPKAAPAKKPAAAPAK